MLCNENKWSENLEQEPKYFWKVTIIKFYLTLCLVECSGKFQKI